MKSWEFIPIPDSGEGGSTTVVVNGSVCPGASPALIGTVPSSRAGPPMAFVGEA